MFLGGCLSDWLGIGWAGSAQSSSPRAPPGLTEKCRTYVQRSSAREGGPFLLCLSLFSLFFSPDVLTVVRGIFDRALVKLGSKEYFEHDIEKSILDLQGGRCSFHG